MADLNIQGNTDQNDRAMLTLTGLATAVAWLIGLPSAILALSMLTVRTKLDKNSCDRHRATLALASAVCMGLLPWAWLIRRYM
jgi:hypothetical protein